MAGPIGNSGVKVTGGGGTPAYGKALALLATLFFMWGFITVINNTLLPHLRSVFDLSYTQTTLIESVWFIAYAVASIPSAFLIKRVGYKRAIIIGLGIMAVGALGMVPAARIPSYEVTLIALFVVACGIALLQVAANPYVAVIGPAETSESRLTLVQAFNSMGTFFAPYFGGYLILSRTVSGTTLEGTAISLEQRMADAEATQLPYILVALVLIGLAFFISRAKLPDLGADDWMLPPPPLAPEIAPEAPFAAPAVPKPRRSRAKASATRFETPAETPIDAPAAPKRRRSPKVASPAVDG